MATKKKPTKTTKSTKSRAKALNATDDDAVKPMLGKDWSRYIKTRAARKAAVALSLTLSETVLAKEYLDDARCEIDKNSGIVQVSVKSRTIGQHAFPPDISVKTLTRRDTEAARLITDGQLHDHLGVSASPAKLARELQVRQRFTSDLGKRLNKDLSLPTNIFGSDDRYVFSDTSFPGALPEKLKQRLAGAQG